MSKAFAVFLQELREGRTHAEMTSALAELLQKVRDTGKGGTITLEIAVGPASRAPTSTKSSSRTRSRPSCRRRSAVPTSTG